MAGMSGLMRSLMDGKGKKAVVEETEDEPSGDDMDLGSEGLLSAMKDLLIAVHKSDPDAMAEAFKDACDLAKPKANDTPEEDDSGDEDGEGPKLDYRR